MALSKLRGGPREVVGTQIWAAGAERSRRPNLDAAERGWGGQQHPLATGTSFSKPTARSAGAETGKKVVFEVNLSPAWFPPGLKKHPGLVGLRTGREGKGKNNPASCRPRAPPRRCALQTSSY